MNIIGKIPYSITILLCFALGSAPYAKAQFFNDGTEPGGTEWSQISTDNYRVVFPRGCEALGETYARALEQVYVPVSGSLGLAPNQNYGKRMPVILHPYTGTSNGTVVWSPRRMEMLTLPDAYLPESTRWVMQLAVHESRHAAQMQMGASHKYRWLNYAVGEFFPSLMSGIYPGSTILEGDAVVAETALGENGRGRSADFLEYQRAAFREGDFRDYWRWNYGSLRRFTPDVYTLGYLTQAGYDYLYGGSFSEKYFGRITDGRALFPFFVLQKTARQMSGEKHFASSWNTVARSWQNIWNSEEEERGPFMEMEPVVEDAPYFKTYKGLVDDGVYLYSVRSGITEAPMLVRIDSAGRETALCPFNSEASEIRFSKDEGRIYWSEFRPDLRWERLGYSDIWYYDIKAGCRRTLTEGHRYFNPQPVPGDSLVAVVNYPVEGGSEVVIISSRDGKEILSYPCSESLQAVELAACGKVLYASAVSSEGTGIYKVHDWTAVLEPQHCKINRLSGTPEGVLNFVSDRNGVNEWYRLYHFPPRVVMLSNTPTGATNFVERWEGEDNWYYFTSLTPRGRLIYRTRVASTVSRTVDFNERHSYVHADSLSAREPFAVDESREVAIGKAEDYNRVAHAFKFHSWMPLYADIDEVSELSAATLFANAVPGATAFFQNELGTLSGRVGYGFRPGRDGAVHGGHAKLTYRGLYPVFETSLDVFSTGRTVTVFGKDDEGNPLSESSSAGALISGNVRVYLPLNLSSGGWSRGIIPQIQLGFDNSTVRVPEGYLDEYGVSGTVSGTTTSRYAASVSAYCYRPVPSSRVYPEWGAGIQAGFGGYTGLYPLFVRNAFVHMYGYVPGLFPTQGLRLSATTQVHLGRALFADRLVSTLPRGYVSPDLANSTIVFPFQLKLGADYAIPFGSIDCSLLCPLAYIRNFELIPHADWCWCHSFKSGKNAGFASLGADFNVVLGNLLWFRFDTRIGVSFNYNPGCREVPFHTGFLFSIEI